MNRSSLTTAAIKTPVRTAPLPLVIANGTLEAVKWLALTLMTLDHVNKYLLNYTMPVLFDLGRIAMPLFVFVLAYNLARPGALMGGVFRRTALRLALYGGLACVPFIALGKVYAGWWPLNIMFTLLLATIVIGLLGQGGGLRRMAAVIVGIVGGGLVEYWWFAIGLAIACWGYCRRPTRVRFGAMVGCIAALWLVNQNPWAFGALPLILAAPHLALSMRRSRLIFYVYYPAHLCVLFVVSLYR